MSNDAKLELQVRNVRQYPNSASEAASWSVGEGETRGWPVFERRLHWVKMIRRRPLEVLRGTGW